MVVRRPTGLLIGLSLGSVGFADDRTWRAAETLSGYPTTRSPWLRRRSFGGGDRWALSEGVWDLDPNGESDRP